jgi:hypothetical protein
MTTWRPPRSRTCRTLATSQPARATSARPGSLASEPLRIRGGLAERHDREAAADVERVERREPAAEQADDRQPSTNGVPPRVDRPQLRADMEVDPARPQRAIAVAAEPLDEGGRLGLVQPEFRCALTHGQLGDRVRDDVRIEPDEDVERRSRTLAQPGASRHAAEHLRLVGRFERDPHERRVAGGRRPDRVTKVGIGLADTLERDPPVRDAGAASDRPLAPRHDVGTEPASGHLRHDLRDVVGLDRVLADPRVREGRADLGGRPVQRAQVGDVGRRAMARGRRAERVRDERGRRAGSRVPLRVSRG